MKKSNLTDATRKEAELLKVATWHIVDHEIDCAHASPKLIIKQLSDFAEDEESYVTAHSDEYYESSTLWVTYKVEHTEEEVRKKINKQIEINKEQAKQLAKESLSRKERLSLEIQELEKQLKRKKSKLEKEK